MPVELSVVIPTHNPDPGRLLRVLAGLHEQTLPGHLFEIVLVDNASAPPIEPCDDMRAFSNLRVAREPELGLSAARRCGIGAGAGETIVLVDDDNVLAPDYLERVLEIFAAEPGIGAIGGKSVPEFESLPEEWVREFDGLLACRDLGDEPRVSDATSRESERYPSFAPIGAGMTLRRGALQSWLEETGGALPDRRGTEMSSGGDNDIVLSILRHGWEVGYFPQLVLTHLICEERTTRAYLARANRGIASSWIQVLSRHGVCPWGPIPRWTAPLRQIKAWFTCRAWAGPPEYVRWQGACGHFDGRARQGR